MGRGAAAVHRRRGRGFHSLLGLPGKKYLHRFLVEFVGGPLDDLQRSGRAGPQAGAQAVADAEDEAGGAAGLLAAPDASGLRLAGLGAGARQAAAETVGSAEVDLGRVDAERLGDLPRRDAGPARGADPIGLVGAPEGLAAGLTLVAAGLLAAHAVGAEAGETLLVLGAGGALGVELEELGGVGDAVVAIAPGHEGTEAAEPGEEGGHGNALGACVFQVGPG